MNEKHKVFLFLEVIKHMRFYYTHSVMEGDLKKQFNHHNFLFPLLQKMIIAHTKGKDKNNVCNDGNIKNLNIKGEIYIF